MMACVVARSFSVGEMAWLLFVTGSKSHTCQLLQAFTCTLTYKNQEFHKTLLYPHIIQWGLGESTMEQGEENIRVCGRADIRTAASLLMLCKCAKF